VSNAPCVDICTLLNANGFGTLGTDLFGMEWGTVGDDPIDQQTLVIDTEGFSSEQKNAYEHITFQILFRGDKRESGKDVYDRARLVHLFLIDSSDSVTINSTEYLGFEPQSNLAPLGPDSEERYIYSMNYFTFRNPE